MPKENTKQPVNPQDETMLDEETQAVGLKKTPQPNKEEAWKKVDAVFNAARSSFLEKGSNFEDVLDSLVSTLMDILATEKQALGGMGTNSPEMDIPAPSQEEELPENL